MKKYNIEYSEREFSDQEIDELMDFDGVLRKQDAHFAYKRRQRKIILTLSLLALPILVTASYFDFGDKVAVFVKEKLKKVEQVILPKAAEPVTPEQLEIKETEKSAEESRISKDISETEILARKTEGSVGEDMADIPGQDIYIKARPGGGFKALSTYLNNNLRYPEESFNNKVTGVVTVNFIIGAFGKIKDVRVVSGINPELDEEALRLIENMPGWKPAMLNGFPVKSRISIPINFTINGE